MYLVNKTTSMENTVHLLILIVGLPGTQIVKAYDGNKALITPTLLPSTTEGNRISFINK